LAGQGEAKSPPEVVVEVQLEGKRVQVAWVGPLALALGEVEVVERLGPWEEEVRLKYS